MARTLGFAQAPGIIAVLGIIPFLGRFIVFIVGLWTLAAVVVAIRQALDIDTGKAILTGIISFVVVMVVIFVPMAMLAGLIAAIT
jgi:hypothetical protein